MYVYGTACVRARARDRSTFSLFLINYPNININILFMTENGYYDIVAG